MTLERMLALLAIGTATAIIAFWVAFFIIGLAPDQPSPCYFAYEHSFPLPDTVLSLVLLGAGLLLLRGAPLGRSLALVAAGGLTFLGLVDASFNYQQGLYTGTTAALVVNGGMNVWCVVLGVVLVLCFSASLDLGHRRSPGSPMTDHAASVERADHLGSAACADGTPDSAVLRSSTDC